MIAKLEFDLDDIFERQHHIQCVKAKDAYLSLYTIRETLQKLNYQDDEESKVLMTPGEVLVIFENALAKHDIFLDSELS